MFRTLRARSCRSFSHVRTLPASGTPSLLNASPRYCLRSSAGENIAQLSGLSSSSPSDAVSCPLSSSVRASEVRFWARRLMSVVVFSRAWRTEQQHLPIKRQPKNRTLKLIQHRPVAKRYSIHDLATNALVFLQGFRRFLQQAANDVFCRDYAGAP